MAELLLELLSEEIPARMQARATADLKRLMAERLKEAGLSYTRLDCFATPRRLALVAGGLPEKQPDWKEERKGPRVDAPEKAVQGFLGSFGLRLDQLERRKTEKGEFWFATRTRAGSPTTHVVLDILGPVVWSFPWPKSMRWADSRATYVRPLRSIVLLFNGQPLQGAIHFEGSISIRFGDTTRGHRFMAPEPFRVKDFADYERKLREAKVILDPFERRSMIWERACQLAAAEDLIVNPDEDLLDEVTGLVEWPVPLLGAIDEAYMTLPPEVLTTAMRHHLKFFACLHKDGRLAPRFVVVANVEASDGGLAIVAGNERVLRARLDDAKFYWDQDRKIPLASRAPKLAEMTFHAKLGTLDAKADRLEALAAELAAHVPGADKDRVRSAACLAKADLTTGMVGEFPELQGVMGRYYALNDGEHTDVADAIADHYAPQGPNDRCPTAPVSVAVALADKIDTLVGFFAVDEKPTGSKDPFALRRAALGAIRLIVENGLRISLTNALFSAYRLYEERLADAFTKLSKGKADEVVATLLDFFGDRLKVALKDKGVRHDLISAVFARTMKEQVGEEGMPGQVDLVRVVRRVESLQRFLQAEDGANLLVAYRRAANIVRIESKNDGRSYAGNPDPDLIEMVEERSLHDALIGVGDAVRPLLDAENFEGAMSEFARLRAPVDAFFDHVRVNTDAAKIRENRLELLALIGWTMNQVADFSRIES